MQFVIKKKDEFEYLEEGEGQPVVLLHGLFGTLSNWSEVIRYFALHYRVIVPLLPLYSMPLAKVNMKGLYEFVDAFVKMMALDRMIIMGNSLGGHIGMLYLLNTKNHRVEKLILTASSGLYEASMGVSFPQRRNYNFIRERIVSTFYDHEIVTKELVDTIFEIIGDTSKCLRMIHMARSAQRNNLASRLPSLKVPTLLIWGLNDTITPPSVAHDFASLIPNSSLVFIDHCCHVPMMEHAEKFNTLAHTFLNRKNDSC